MVFFGINQFIFSRYILLLLVLFAIPGVVMIVAYGLISRELYKGIRFEMGHKKDSPGEATHQMRKRQEWQTTKKINNNNKKKTLSASKSGPACVYWGCLGTLVRAWEMVGVTCFFWFVCLFALSI